MGITHRGVSCGTTAIAPAKVASAVPPSDAQLERDAAERRARNNAAWEALHLNSALNLQLQMQRGG